MNSDTGKYIVVFGAGIIVLGLFIYFFYDKLGWIGRLPGDIRIERDNFSFYFPITTMILISVFVTVVVNVARRLF